MQRCRGFETAHFDGPSLWHELNLPLLACAALRRVHVAIAHAPVFDEDVGLYTCTCIIPFSSRQGNLLCASIMHAKSIIILQSAMKGRSHLQAAACYGPYTHLSRTSHGYPGASRKRECP